MKQKDIKIIKWFEEQYLEISEQSVFTTSYCSHTNAFGETLPVSMIHYNFRQRDKPLILCDPKENS